MENLVKNPYLPDCEVSCALAGSAAESLKDDFNRIGIKLITGICENTLSGSLCGHIDMAMTPFPNKEYFISKNQQNLIKIISENSGTTFFIKNELKPKYPFDSLYNCVIIGNKIIYNPKSTAKEIVDYAVEKKFKIIQVNQGYTKCSVCPITENAAITDDSGIYLAMKSFGMDVLLISKGSIRLDGFNYGFIGGSASMISKDFLLFFGNKKLHSDYYKIKDFLDNYNINAISLNNNQISDIGSIIPLTESGN